MSGRRIVICGGGAIGVAVAYFLSRRGATADRDRAPRSGRCGVGQVGRLSGARLVPRHAARPTGATQLRAACRACRRTRQSVGLSTPGDVCRSRRRKRHGTRHWTDHRQATVAVRQRDAHGSPWLATDDGAGRAARLHHGPDAGRPSGGRGATARHRRRPGARTDGSDQRRRARRRRDRRGRRRGRRDGTVVDPGDALAALARSVRLQGP